MFDLNNIRLGYTDAVEKGYFAEYSPAYVTTNEDIKSVVRYLKPSGKRVLITTGSGDGPMLFRANGASDVDSFDISFCAKAIMDMKVSALQNMSLNQYITFLKSLRNANQFDKYADTINGCPMLTRQFITHMNGCNIFSNGQGVDDCALPNPEEYTKMRKNIHSPLPFIWSDLDSLAGKLTKKYDIIYLSNIFQYEKDRNNIVRVLNSLRPYLNVGGHIMVHATWYFRNFETDNYMWAADKVKSWGRLYKMVNDGNQYAFLQRIR